MTISISVLVPVRDDPRVDDLLASLAAQRGAAPFEIVVALDGARRRPKIPAGLAARLLALPPRGPYAARNAAAREAGGDVLLFTDSDCLCPPDWVARAVVEFEDASLAALQGASVGSDRSRLSRFVQLEYDRYVTSHAAAGYRRFCNTRNFGIRAAIVRELPLPDRFPRGGDGVYGRRLEARGIAIRYASGWIVEHRHPTTRWREGVRAFEEGRDGARWEAAEGVDLFGDASPASGPGARLVRVAGGSRTTRRAAAAALLPVAGFLAGASAVLPGTAGAAAFSRFRRAAHLAGRFAGGAAR